MRYYAEYPYDEFNAETDKEALDKCNSSVLYREDQESLDGLPFVFIRNTKGQGWITGTADVDALDEESWTAYRDSI